MANPRSVSQQEFEAKYQQIKKSRNIEIALLIGLDVLSAGSTSLVLIDLTQLTGIAIGTALALTSASILFFALLGLSIVCGIVCGIYMLREAINKRNAELALMQKCHLLTEQQVQELNNYKEYLADLLKTHKDPKLQEMYDELCNEANTDVHATISKIEGYMILRVEDNFPQFVTQRRIVDPVAPIINEQYNNNWLSHLIAFFTGAGQVLGICASIIGVSPLAGLLFTPAGLPILAIVILLSVAVGLGAVYLDYRLRASQQAHMDVLEQGYEGVKKISEQLKSALPQAEKYRMAITLQSEKFNNKNIPIVEATAAPSPAINVAASKKISGERALDIGEAPAFGVASTVK